MKEIIHNIQKVLSLDFEPTQIERAKNSILSDDLHENETVQGQAQTIGYLESLTGNLNSKKEYLDRIVDVSPDDISKVSSEFLRLENLNLNIIIPKESLIKEKQHFEDLISDSFSRNLSVKNEQSESYLPKDYSMSDILYEKPKLLKLDNGISLLVLQNNKTPLFSLRSISLGGLKYETQESNGKFSIMAELFERGSLSLTKDELSMKTEILASDIEGYSGKNTVGMKLLGPSANLNELVDIFSDVLCNPLFLDDELDIVKKDILSYLNRKKQNYAALAADKFYELLFPNHPYSMNQYGSESSVLEISRREISEAYKGSIFNKNLLRRNIKVKVKCLDMSLDIKNPESNIKKDLEFTPIKEDKIFETKLGDKQQSHIMIGTYAPSLESNDQYAFQVMNSCLSGMGGRLFVELRDKQSLAYTVSSFYSPAPSIGHFGVYIGCSPEKKDQSIDAINLEISNLVSNGVTKSEIERAKNYLIGRNDISLQRNSAINARISQGTFFGLGPEEPFEFSSKIRSVSLDEVNHVISKYLKNSNKVIVAFQPS